MAEDVSMAAECFRCETENGRVRIYDRENRETAWIESDSAVPLRWQT